MQRLLRYFRLYSTFCKVGLLQQMAYRPHFFLMVFGKLLRMILLLFFFQAIFLQVDRLGRWDYDRVLLLFATFHLVDYLMSITFQRNLSSYFPRRVHTGELDDRMVLPVNLLFLVSFEAVDIMDFFSFIPSLGFLLYVLGRMGFAFGWAQWLAYAVLVLNALVFVYALFLAIAATSFWTVQSSGLSSIADNLLKVARYPVDIFGDFWKVVFLYLFPAVLIAQLPSEALLQALRPGTILIALGATGLFLLLAVLLWRRGLRRYSSAST